MTDLDELRARRPGNRARIDQVRHEMERTTADYRLRQLREDAGFRQNDLAKLIGVGQNRISQMEHGNLVSAKVETLQRYVEATGGTLEVVVTKADGTRISLALT